MKTLFRLLGREVSWRRCACAALLLACAIGVWRDPSAADAISKSVLTSSVNDAVRISLPGHLHSLARRQFDVGAVPGTLPMVELKLILKRSAAQEADLKQFLTAQQSKESGDFHHWLTPAQFGARFGASDQDIATASAWLQAHSFSVGSVPPGRGLLPFTGTAAQVEVAFHTPIHYFSVDGVKHFSNTANPQIPAAFGPLVSGIRGLHDFRPHTTQRSPQATPQTATNEGNLVSPGDFSIIYNFAPLYKDAITGAGITVAVAAQSDIDPSVAASYWTAFGVSQGQQIASVAANASTDPGKTNDGAESEAYADVEVIGGLAPNAKIILVRDKNSETAFDYAIEQNLAPILNVSFGTCESDLGASNASVNNIFQQAAAQGITVLVAAGDSGIASCDDSIRATQGDAVVTGLSVNGLASTPYNVAVGGTDFNPVLVKSGSYWNTGNTSGTYANAKSYIPEMVWNLSCANPVTAQLDGVTDLIAFCNNSTYASLQQILGGGGGISSCTTVGSGGSCASGYAVPTWQAAGVLGTQGLTARAIPDVAMLANDWMICDQSITTCGPPNGTFEGYYGTSLAAPAMSAIMALLDQALITPKNPDGRQGNITPFLYALASLEYGSTQAPNTTSLQDCNANNGATVNAGCIFYDITSGSVDQPCSISNYALSGSLPVSNCTAASGDAYGIVELGTTITYNAGQGYDMASGLGSINASNFVGALVTLQGPSGLSASASGTTVNLTWSADTNATGYNVYSGASSGGESGTPIVTGVRGTSSAVTGLQSGQTYYFFIGAQTTLGVSFPSNQVMATLVPAAPTGLSTSAGATSVTLSWSASSGATSYSVLQGTATGGESTMPVATGLTSTSFVVNGTPGQTAYFKVVAVNGGGNSTASSEASGTVLPGVPSGLAASGGSAMVTLTWSAGAGATGYNIYQSTTAGGEGTTPIQSNVSGTSATVASLASSTTYYFTVSSVNAGGHSAASNEASASTTAASSGGGGGGGSVALWDLLLAGALVLIRCRFPAVARRDAAL